MSESEEKKVVVRVLEDFWSFGKVTADDVYAKNYVRNDPHAPGIEGPAAIAQLADMYRKAFPDMRFEVQQLLGEKDTVSARYRFHGTQTGDLPFLPATQRKVDITGLAVFRIADGRVHEDWHNYDMLTMLRQLGAIPAG